MKFLARLASPEFIIRYAGKISALLALASAAAFAAGLYFALYASPPDYQQGETVRMMYVHVPAASIGMAIYAVMAVAAALGFVTRWPLADAFCVAAAPVGATLVALCLVTGSLWGKPTWGAWWVWDARLTSVLILFLLYCGYIALRHSFDDDERGGKAGSILLLIGAVNIPIVKFSVEWWHTLHQPASLFRKGGNAIHPDMLRPLAVMAAAFALYAAFLVLLRLTSVLMEREIRRFNETE